MKEWKEYRIKDLGEVITGNTPPTSNREYYGTEYKFIKPTDMVEGQRFVPTTEEYYSELAYQKYKKCLLPPKTPCVVTIGSLGKKMCLTDTECFTNQAVNAVIPNKENDGEFLYYAFKASVLAYVKQLDSGTTSGRENVSKSSFSKIKVRVPPLSTQQKIASILSAYDNLIQNYKKQIEALQTAASELYKEWFVRFRFPGYQTTRFENGIPEGWKIERLGKLTEIKSGKRLPQGYNFSDCPTSHPYIRARDIKHGNIDSNDFAYISDDVYQKLKRYIVDENDILLTIVANIGDVGYVNKSLQGFNLTENAVRLTNYSERIESRYLCYYLSQPATKIYMEGLVVGAAQAKLGIYKIETIKVLLPNINIQKDFSRRITLIHTKIDNLNKQITNLTQQRNLLLPRLMSGNIIL